MTAMRVRRCRHAKNFGLQVLIRRWVKEWAAKYRDPATLPPWANYVPEPVHAFQVGDLAVRASDDIQRVTWVSDGGSLATFECIKAPASGWCAVGDVETNLTRRYRPLTE